VLDHAFTDAIDALRQSLEKALLERVDVEEHLNADILSGDLTWETSYGLPGEDAPPLIKADVTLVWSTWSQSSFRDWYAGDGFSDPPKLDIEITLRVQRLAVTPDVEVLLAAVSSVGPSIDGSDLYRSGPTVEQTFDPAECAFEVAYGGTYELDEKTLEDSGLVDVEFAALGGWIASALVRLNDLNLTYRESD
jgi:hypothetical protein